MTELSDDELGEVHLWTLAGHVDTALGVVRSDGTVALLTDAITAITGFPPRHYVGRPFTSEVHPEDLAGFTDAMSAVIDAPDGSRTRARLRIATAAGGWLWVDQVVTRAVSVPGVGGYIASVRDVDEEHRAVAALERREAALRALLDSTSDAVVVMNDEGRITWMTSAAREVSGWSEAQLVSMRVGDLVHPGDLDAVAATVLGILGGEPPVGFTCRVRNAAGEYRWLDVDVQDLRSVPDVDGVALSLRDVDDVVTAQLALEASERRFRALVQHGSDVVFTFDADRRVTSVTDSVRVVLGFDVEQVVSARAFDNVVWADRPLVEGALARLQSRPGATERLRLRVRDAHGELRWTEARVTNLVDHPEVGDWVCNFWDVTAMVRAEEENQRLLEIFDLTEDQVTLVDREGRLLYMNAAGRRFFGLSEERLTDLVGTVWPLRDDLNEGLGRIVDADEAFTSWSGEILATGRDGVTPLSMQVLAHRGEDGRIAYYSATARDISERKELEASLERQATHDPLTGLPNRTLLFERIEAAVGGLRATGSDHRVGLLFIDLDHFKVINDSLGHALGDRLLREVGERIRTAVRPGDTVARFGGDEFVVLCERLDDPDDAVVIAHRVESTLQRPFVVDGHHIHAAVSIGIAFADPTDPEPTAVLRDADTAMYRAKSDGRGRWVIFDDQLRHQAVERQRLETDLRATRDGEQLVLHYQPVADLATGRITSVEALVRWCRDGALVAPDEFIPVAEETGLIVPIGAWVLRTACAAAAAWQVRPGTAHVGLAVNVSARQLLHTEFVPLLADVLASTGVRPGSLSLEITETVLLDDVEQSRHRLEELRSLGVRVAVDDFGTGYSSLTYLHQLPVDVVKLDRSFVAGVGSQDGDTAIVTAVVNLASALGLESVAEGIETELQLQRLRDLGCQQGQGYLLSRPVPADQLQDLLDRGVVGSPAT